MDYRPPTTTFDVLASIELDEALDPDDPRLVDTEDGRGSQATLRRLAAKFNLDLRSGRFVPPTGKHVALFGHRGSGKTTELRRYSRMLAGPERFLVVEVSVVEQLDRHNFEYPDLLMALAQSLADRMIEKGVGIDPAGIQGLERWFAESVEHEEGAEEFVASLESGVAVEPGLPFLAKLFARFTSSFKTNATYKNSLRRVVRNTYAQFAEGFNDLVRAAEGAAAPAGLGLRVLFIVDGTDKMSVEDTRRLFAEDVEQLLGIEALVIYTAPIALKYEQYLVGDIDTDLVLPMIKLADADGEPFEPGLRAAREILVRRADPSVFATGAEIETLIEYSGGHPRELLRLLKLCCELSDDRIDADTVDGAVLLLAGEHRRVLQPDDYGRLAAYDADPLDSGNDDATRRLLLNLALLEYNDGTWRRSHPVIRRLEGYRRATAGLQAEGEPTTP